MKSAEHGGETGYTFGKDEAHVHLGNMLVVTNKAESLKSLIDRRNAHLEKSDKPAKKRSLAEDETFQAARKHAAEEDAGFAFVRLAPLRLLAGMAREFGPEKKADNLIAELLAGGVIDAVGHAVRGGDVASRRRRPEFGRATCRTNTARPPTHTSFSAEAGRVGGAGTRSAGHHRHVHGLPRRLRYVDGPQRTFRRKDQRRPDAS